MTATGDPLREAPSPDEVRRAVDRMVMSDVFSRSPQLGAFLRFVVEAVLRDEQDGTVSPSGASRSTKRSASCSTLARC
ncbi:MAG: hypothetical protein ACRECO_02515 [Xanthobacteraceae bacterium]